ncbi:MAG: hypothetical protein JWN48_5300 [Myxococcaceae bacterium]|nr:hypothetical protein [Myxococcaceae bacterium]
MNAMKTLVVGAGGVGGYLAAQLALAGFDVTVIARGEHGQALAARGITIRTGEREQHARFSRVVAAADALQERFELILLAVKWPELETACDALPNLIAVDGVVVPLLNGLSSEDVVATYVGAQRTLSGVAYMSAGLLEPGVIYAQSNTRVGLSPYRPGQDAELTRVAGMFRQAGVPVQESDDYRAMLWQKMLWNAPFNGLCALSQLSAGACVEQMEELVRRAMLEVIAVARAEQVTLPEQLVDAMLTVTRQEFGLTEPSMLQDVRKGRPTEVDILQGEVVRRAERLGVDVPVLSTLAGLIRGLTRAPSPDKREVAAAK